MAADLLLYAWIAYNGCSWTIGYKKYLYMASGFSRKPMLLTRTAKNPSSACASRRPPSVRSFFWFLFSLYPFLAVLPAGKMLLMLSAYRRLFRKITAKPH